MQTGRSWTRTSTLGAPSAIADESWMSPDGARHDVRVHFGKKVDIFGLKAATFARFAASVDEIRSSRTAMYAAGNVEPVPECPICAVPTSETRVLGEVYGATYCECPGCSHVYVRQRMTAEAVTRFYSEDKAYAATYTDKERAQLRVAQVAKPKAEWAVRAFQRKYGREPRWIVDVGAGGGHFVKACRDLGLRADGVEVSDSSQHFCREHFGFDLVAAPFDVDYERFRGADMITYWGVIEHVPFPRRFITATRAAIAPEGMVVTAVPRWTSLSTAVQMLWSDTLVRHMDPGGHIHVFSDSSLLTLLTSEKLAPTEAWFFGMDVYELVSQVLHRAGDGAARLGEQLQGLVPHLQPFVDANRISDEIAVAAVPV